MSMTLELVSSVSSLWLLWGPPRNNNCSSCFGAVLSSCLVLPSTKTLPSCLSFFPIFTVNLSPSLWSNTTSSKVSIRNYSTIFLEFRVCPGSVLGPGEVVAGKKKKPHQRRTFERRGNDKDRDSGNENRRCKVSEGRISRTFKVSVDGV